MSEINEAYTVGAQMGALFAGFQRAAEQLAQGFEAGKRAVLAMQESTPEMREALSKRRYERRIAEERRIGREFVAKKAMQARLDLGLL